MMTRTKLADILFPEVTQTIEDLMQTYPPRAENQPTLRFAPSPT
ncbi:MAG: hypothetical protein Q4B28_07275 [bacterium]|nr:hypothetical protein [bacterium]